MNTLIKTIGYSLFFITSVMAQDLSVGVGNRNELILTGASCEELLKQESAMCEWKKKADGNFVMPKLPANRCKQEKKGKAKLAILECLPEFTKAYHQKKLVHDGPNCWGTAMSFNKLSPVPRFMWPEEMQYWMNSPVCRKLDIGEKKLPGDVINVYAPEKLDEKERTMKDAGTFFWEALYPKRYTPVPQDPNSGGYTGFQRLLHSATYITDGLAFGKDSPSVSDRFYFHKLSEVYGRPPEAECQENQALEPYIREYQKTPQRIRGSKCSYMSLAYRCENFNDYFSNLKLNQENADTWKNVKSLQGLQEKLFPLVVSSNKVLEDCEVTLLLSLADITVARVTNDLKKPKLDKTREMLLVQEYFAAAGIRETLVLAGLVKPAKK